MNSVEDRVRDQRQRREHYIRGLKCRDCGAPLKHSRDIICDQCMAAMPDSRGSQKGRNSRWYERDQRSRARQPVPYAESWQDRWERMFGVRPAADLMAETQPRRKLA